MSKDKVQEQHGRLRLAERFGFDDYDYDLLVSMTKKSNYNHPDVLEHIFIRQESRRTSKHMITYKGKKMIYVYDKQAHNIITFLFPKE